MPPSSLEQRNLEPMTNKTKSGGHVVAAMTKLESKVHTARERGDFEKTERRVPLPGRFSI